MPAASGLGAAGKNRNKNAIQRKQMAKMLIGMPSLPRLNREGGNRSPRSRLVRMTPMTTRYEVKRPVAETDKMMLNAVVEPMMISAMSTVKSSVT